MYVGVHIFNGVRVLSLVLFSVYLDRLLEELARSGVDCHCGCLFAGAFYCYVDDIVLLEPCLSFRIMETCDKYAHNHLMLTKLSSAHVFNISLSIQLSITSKFENEATHLGHFPHAI